MRIRKKIIIIIIISVVFIIKLSHMTNSLHIYQEITNAWGQFWNSVTISEDFDQNMAWQTAVKSWDQNFKIEPNILDLPVVFTFPEKVQFLLDLKSPCYPKTPLIIAVMNTAIDHIAHRNFIRRTWGNSNFTALTGLKVVFMVGLPDDEPHDGKTPHELQAMIEKEWAQHSDLVQSDFVDTYRNLTYKSTASLRWVNDQCLQAPFMLKLDDDVVVDPFQLSEYIVEILKTKPHPTEFMGNIFDGNPILREGRYKVDYDSLKGKYFPRMLSGYFYLQPSTIIPALLQGIARTKYFGVDDAFITGVVAKKVNVSHIDLTGKSFFDGPLGDAETKEKVWKSFLNRYNHTDLTPNRLHLN